MSVILLDWSGTLSNFKKKDLLNGKKVINESLIPLLKHNRIGIISNTSKNAKNLIRAVEHEFERVKLKVEIQVYNTIFQNENLFRKPSPWMIWYALYKMNICDYNKVLFVGDKKSDYLAACAARVKFIYINNLMKNI